MMLIEYVRDKTDYFLCESTTYFKYLNNYKELDFSI